MISVSVSVLSNGKLSRSSLDAIVQSMGTIAALCFDMNTQVKIFVNQSGREHDRHDGDLETKDGIELRLRFNSTLTTR